MENNTGKKVYSLKTFKWGYFGKKVVIPAVILTLIVLWVSSLINQPQWGNVSAGEMLELKNMETVEVEAELGDSFWSIQNSIQPGEMWELHDAFVALNPHYDGTTIQAGLTYVFVRYLDKK